jgi:hypothetical protein
MPPMLTVMTRNLHAGAPDHPALRLSPACILARGDEQVATVPASGETAESTPDEVG